MKTHISLAAWVIVYLLSGFGAMAATNRYSGSLSNNFYRFNRPASLSTLSGSSVYFHPVYFTVQGSSPGSVTANITAVGFTPRVHFYQNASFNPYAPTDNLWWLGGSGSTTATNIASGIAIPHLLIVSGTNPNDTGTFTVTFTGPGQVDADTNSDNSLILRAQPADASILSGQTATFNLWASGRQPQKIQWYYGPRPASTNAPDPAKIIAGATNQSYTTPALTTTTSYWALVTGTNTSPTNARTREATATVSVAPANFNGTITAKHDTWNRMTTLGVSSGQICYFEVVPFRIVSAGTYNVSVTNVGYPGALNLYTTKFFPGTPAVNFAQDGVVAASAGVLNYSMTLQPGDYDLVVSTASSGQVGTYAGKFTGPSVVELLPRPTIPVFLNLPPGKTAMTNTTATLSFTVEGAVPRTNQWYRGIPPDASQPIANATNKSYTTPILPAVGTNFYWARVANSYGAATSGPVRVKVVDGPIKFAGKLRAGNKRYQRSNGSGGMVPQLTYYKTYVFEAPTLGTYTITLNTTGFVGAAAVYNQVFMTNNPNVNLSLIPGSASTFNLNVASPSTYWLVISTASAGEAGSYGGTITGPSPVNELPAPVFNPQPAPTNQFLWRNENPAAIIGQSDPTDAAWSWYYGASPGVPVDGLTAIPDLDTRTNDQPASVTAQPTNYWFWARIDGAYGYDDSDLARIEVCPPPSFMTYPASRSIVYGNTTNLNVLVTNVPFLVRWHQAVSPNTGNPVQSDVVQGFGASYLRAVAKTNTTPMYNVGVYSYWLQSTNPTGGTNGPTFTITVTPRPLTVSNSVPAGVIYDGLPHPVTPSATDPVPGGPALPVPMPFITTYRLGTGTPLTNEPVNAGTYMVISTVNHSNYMGAATNTLVIAPRPLTVSNSNPAGVVYDGLSHPVTPSATDPVPGGPTLPVPMPFITTYQFGAGAPTTLAPVNAGTYQVISTVNHSNYIGSATNQFVIGPRPLTVSNSIPAGVVYDGLPHPVTPSATDPIAGGPTLPEPMPFVTKYQFGAGPLVTNVPLNAGMYQVVSTINHSNYVGGATNAFVLRQRPLTVSNAIPAEVVYDGLPHPITPSATDPVAGGPTLPVPMPFVTKYQFGPEPLVTNAPLNAGMYQVVSTINHSNYVGGVTNAFVLGHRPLIVSNSIPAGVVYDGLPHPVTPSATDPVAGGPTLPVPIPFVTQYQFGAGPLVTNVPVNAGTYQVVSTINHSNYFGRVTNAFVLGQRPLAVSNSVPTGVVYDGLAHLVMPSATDPVAGGPTLPIPMPITTTYQLGASTPGADEPVNAGTYQVISTVSHSNYVGRVTNSLVIAQYPVTVRGEHKSRMFNAENPALTLVYSALTNNETLSVIDVLPVASTPAASQSPIGQYPITPAGGSDNNYAFSYVNGTLTVLGEPVVVTWWSDFSSNARLAGTLTGSAASTNGVLQLTTSSNTQIGQFNIASPGWPLHGLHVEFDLLIGGGGGADGFSFNYGPEVTNAPTFAEKGFNTGLGVLVDTYDNGGEAVPNIAIKYGGVVVAQKVVPQVRENAFNRLTLDVYTNGMLTLKHKGVILFTNVPLVNWAPLPEWQFSLAARTGWVNDNHWVDNLLIGERSSMLYLPISPAPVTLALPPAFADLASLSYTATSSNPAFVSASVDTNGWALLSVTSNSVGSATLTLGGSNGTVNGSVPFAVAVVQPSISSVAGTNGPIQVRLAGPANASYSVQQRETWGTAPWKSVARGRLAPDGSGVVTDTNSSAGSRFYRLQLTR